MTDGKDVGKKQRNRKTYECRSLMRQGEGNETRGEMVVCGQRSAMGSVRSDVRIESIAVGGVNMGRGVLMVMLAVTQLAGTMRGVVGGTMCSTGQRRWRNVRRFGIWI